MRSVDMPANLAGRGIERDDAAAAKHADQQVITKLAKPGGRHRHSPGGIHPGPVLETHQQVASRIESVDVSQLGSLHIVVLSGILLSERDEEVAIDVQDVERRE